MNRLFSSWAAHLPKRGPRALLAAGFLVAALLFGTGSFALPAHAATPAHVATRAHVATTPRAGYVTIYWTGVQTGSTAYHCVQGIAQAIFFNSQVIYAVGNGCPDRVWIYTNSDASGPDFCINHNTTTEVPTSTRWKSFKDSYNTNLC